MSCGDSPQQLMEWHGASMPKGNTPRGGICMEYVSIFGSSIFIDAVTVGQYRTTFQQHGASGIGERECLKWLEMAWIVY